MPYSNPQTPTAGQPSNFFNQAQTLMGSSNPTNAAAGVVAGGAAPGIAQSGLSMQQLLSEIGLVGPTVGEQAASSTLDTNYALQQAALGEQGLGIQQAGLAAQSGLLGTQKGIEEAQYGLQSGQYPEQLAEAALQNQNAVQQLSSQGAISGTLNTEGHKQAVATQAANYGYQQQDINRAQQEAALSQQGQEAQFQYSAGDIARSQQNLELTAKANGLSVQQLLAQWQQGLQQIGVQADPTQLYTQYLAQQGNQIGTLGSIAGQLGLLSPGTLANGAMVGGFNPTNLFSGG